MLIRFGIPTRQGRFLNGLQVVLAASLLNACSPAGSADSATLEVSRSTSIPEAVLAQGASVYEQTCAVCHYAGSGSATAPDLVSSAELKQPARELITNILQGRQGVSVVNGRKFNGIMPAQNTLSDEDIAAVVTYVRHTFGGADEVTAPADVAAYRR